MIEAIGRILASDVFRGGALFLAVISGSTAVILQLVRNRPTMRKLEDEKDAAIRSEGRTDLKDCKERIDQLQAALADSNAKHTEEITALKDGQHHFEMKLLGTISAYRLLDAEVETRLPGSSALAQARLIISTAFTMSPSTSDAFFNTVPKSETLKAAEDACHATEVTVEKVKREESLRNNPAKEAK
jgi:hypothetical protein